VQGDDEDDLREAEELEAGRSKTARFHHLLSSEVAALSRFRSASGPA
jgi:hypothetical protein